MFMFRWQVTVGFTTAAALTIGSSQIKSLLGLKGSANGFMESWINALTHIGDTKVWDTLLGCCTIVLLLSLKRLKYRKQMLDDDSANAPWNETKKYLSLGRNALAVAIGTVLAYSLHLNNLDPFSLTGVLTITSDYALKMRPANY